MDLSDNLRYYRKTNRMTQKELASVLGTNNTNISNWEKGISKPDIETLIRISKYFEVSLDELLFKEKRQIDKVRGQTPAYLQPGITFEHERQTSVPQLSPFSLGSDSRMERQLVPLYDLEATAGLVPLLTRQHEPVDHISIPDLPRCDGAVYVRGDSMYPLLKSGDIVLYRQVANPQAIIWGEMYLISFTYNEEEYISVKYVKKSDGHPGQVQLVSYNPHHAPIEIDVSSIRAMAMVKASIRFNTMG